MSRTQKTGPRVVPYDKFDPSAELGPDGNAFVLIYTADRSYAALTRVYDENGDLDPSLVCIVGPLGDKHGEALGLEQWIRQTLTTRCFTRRQELSAPGTRRAKASAMRISGPPPPPICGVIVGQAPTGPTAEAQTPRKKASANRRRGRHVFGEEQLEMVLAFARRLHEATFGVFAQRITGRA